MATLPPEIINESNISRAWGRAFLRVMGCAREALPPIVVSFSGFEHGRTLEAPRIREALDRTLQKHGLFSCDTSGMTIFPFKHWIRSSKPGWQELSSWYTNRFLPRLRARDRTNAYGTYFERMVACTGLAGYRGQGGRVVKNQLGSIVTQWGNAAGKGRRPRQSALQIGFFDPAKDHTGQAMRGFPCLQQVSFNYDESGGLSVNAFYPCQYVFDRAYGNYLGLSH